MPPQSIWSKISWTILPEIATRRQISIFWLDGKGMQGSEEDMWVPYSEVRPLAAFEEYVRQHPELGRFGIFPDESEKPMAAQRPRKKRKK